MRNVTFCPSNLPTELFDMFTDGSLYAGKVLGPGIIDMSHSLTGTQQQTSLVYSNLWEGDEEYAKDYYLQHILQSMQREFPLARNKNFKDRFLGKTILDLGCGAGYGAYALFGEDFLRNSCYIGIDASDSVFNARAFFDKKDLAGLFVKADFTKLKKLTAFADFVLCSGVIQHTDSPEVAVSVIANTLRTGGVAFLNCYKVATPIREFSDDLIHNCLADLSPQDALAALQPLTDFGIALGESGHVIRVPLDIPFLGIPRGDYPIQQFFFDYLFRAYYHKGHEFSRLNYSNFDWYAPKNQHHLTGQRFLSILSDAGLSVLSTVTSGTFISCVAEK